MLTRTVIALALALAVAGCASEAPPIAGFGATSALSVTSPAAAAVPSAVPPVAYRKTMSDRVLAAIALERVTGMKPDPARFAE